MASPSVDAALRVAAAQVSGLTPNPDDVRVATYGPEQNLAQTVGYQPQLTYDDYMRWMNRGNLPVQPESGAHYSAPGSMHGYMNYGLPPVVQQRSPYATAAYRSYVDPFGQMMVQPLVGFPSAYPHVLSGVPMNMNYGLEWAMGGVPLGQGLGVFQVPPSQTPPVAKQQKTTAPRNTQVKQPTVPPATPPAGQHWVHLEGSPENYALVPDDFSQAALHPAYEGQPRIDANYLDMPNLQPPVQLPVNAAPSETPVMRNPYGIGYNTTPNSGPLTNSAGGIISPGSLPGSRSSATQNTNLFELLWPDWSASQPAPRRAY